MIAVTFELGPSSGLQLTVNVQQYENLPFSNEDSGIKASWSFAIKTDHYDAILWEFIWLEAFWYGIHMFTYDIDILAIMWYTFDFAISMSRPNTYLRLLTI